MKRTCLLDTGPLVAFLNRRDQYHAWAKAQLATIDPPLLTCEAVISEACFLLRKLEGGPDAVIKLINRGLVTIAFQLKDEIIPVGKLLARYSNLPISFADACLVRMTEQSDEPQILTLDRDFRVYRKNGRQAIPVIMPKNLS